MDRVKRMAELAGGTLEKRFTAELEQLVVTLEHNHQALAAQLRETLTGLFAQVHTLQAAGEKGILAYVSFSMLQSNLLLGKYAFQIDAYDERFFIDDAEASAEWDFSPLLQGVGQDFGSVRHMLRQSIPRVQEYELWELEQAYRVNYYAYSAQILQTMLPHALKGFTPVDAGVSAASPLLFTFGAYMEQQTPFFEWEWSA